MKIENLTNLTDTHTKEISSLKIPKNITIGPPIPNDLPIQLETINNKILALNKTVVENMYGKPFLFTFASMVTLAMFD
jgi:hypothetical protein